MKRLKWKVPKSKFYLSLFYFRLINIFNKSSTSAANSKRITHDQANKKEESSINLHINTSNMNAIGIGNNNFSLKPKFLLFSDKDKKD